MFVQYACKKVAVRQMSVMLRKCQHMGTTPWTVMLRCYRWCIFTRSYGNSTIAMLSVIKVRMYTPVNIVTS